jgi:hypothetical protein
MMVGAPYDRHASPAASSFAGSHVFVIRRASALTGSIVTSPFGGTIMRRCQCSATTDTQ